MKRLHVSLAVSDLDRSIDFYTTLFGSEPSVRKRGYAKWMLEDPRVNFVLDEGGHGPGVDHLGIQVESEAELAGITERLARAEAPLLEERAAECCYARSDKAWSLDPQGIPWEAFHTHGAIDHYGSDTKGLAALEGAMCCAPPAADATRAVPTGSRGP